jgi:hypothetical protein
MYSTKKQFATDTNIKQAVTSWVQCVARSVWYWTPRDVNHEKFKKCRIAVRDV